MGNFEVKSRRIEVYRQCFVTAFDKKQKAVHNIIIQKKLKIMQKVLKTNETYLNQKKRLHLLMSKC